MKISVIMSVYNGEKYLNECLRSILNQSYSNFELLIVNDCSTDKTEEIIYKFIPKDTRIKYFKNHENKGLTKNLNKMISLSSGEVIARMDADDIACKDRFLNQIHVFEQNKDVDVVFTNACIINDKSNHVCDAWRPNNSDEMIKLMPYFNYIIHPSTMIKKETIYNVGLYDENYITGQDHELWLRIIRNKGRFYYLNKNLLYYRINPNSVRSNLGENYNYKLSKVCIANGNKNEAIKYLGKLNLKEKIDVLIRCLFPFWMYRKIIYGKDVFKFIK
ncbi:glycosyltransferase family 2 protein [Lentibacillus cibarius]|uniref:Glycosyltransferase n=1 Tax=Lentibacillus cibarius TaxID=2583219 RepID=A0A5S3QJ40_9BACI|nr:glycosyltransferase [Lentibacillus cibarius]TMN21934.1 glycosyltransferase [Lentibacillus cibarius]